MAGLYTIGYQGMNLDGFIDFLKAQGIGLLADVRAVAWSRKPGFAHRPLAEALNAAGIAYRHFPVSAIRRRAGPP